MMKNAAIITGASSGIGLEFANQLAEKKYNLVLIARRKEKLENLASELQDLHKIDTLVLPADLSVDSELKEVGQKISELDEIELLVNNAGFGLVGSFTSISYEKHEQMLDVHIRAPVYLTRKVLPIMVEQGNGSIINVASVGAFFPKRASTIYAPTKRFLVDFSKAIDEDYKSENIKIQALCPGYTYSGFHKTSSYKESGRNAYEKIPDHLWMTSEQVVKSSLDALGNKVICIPGWKYKLAVFLTKFGINLG